MRYQVSLVLMGVSSALAIPFSGFDLSDFSLFKRAPQYGNPPPPKPSNFLDGHPWVPASEIGGSSRSPCPMLNTLANHGFLNRNGRDIPKQQFVTAQVDALNFAPELATTIRDGMLAKLGAPANQSRTFALEQFNFHDHTEHDASLTRLDKIQGDFVTVNKNLVQKLLADSSTSSLDTRSIGKSRVRREKESIAAGSPPLSDAFTAASQAEASLILVVVGTGGETNTDERAAPKTQVQDWLNREIFPVDKGYQRSSTVLTADLVGLLTAGIKEFHDDILGEEKPKVDDPYSRFH